MHIVQCAEGEETIIGSQMHVELGPISKCVRLASETSPLITYRNECAGFDCNCTRHSLHVGRMRHTSATPAESPNGALGLWFHYVDRVSRFLVLPPTAEADLMDILMSAYFSFSFQKNKELMNDIISNCKIKNGEFVLCSFRIIILIKSLKRAAGKSERLRGWRQ